MCRVHAPVVRTMRSRHFSDRPGAQRWSLSGVVFLAVGHNKQGETERNLLHRVRRIIIGFV